ncbi:malate dehydrogenase (quinone) [Methylophilus rhizosphaerae]|uniref:Probable malate:quinone oxidoreductase n=1 Tax=Methylophilus rhizosphaerae TaxID=492660 RepID=A0A1G8Z5J2_9PROT|nr:malate dehydrogenase (quinone) [Methylophilus rhizosphaerae]SDK09904.1 malate dehydrogenase (quinone) [Methylophilus rhizosphaerae]
MATTDIDVLLVGGGIMSATLAILLHRLDPQLHICMVEQLEDVALESSDALNNAGTGHAGYCELNYTPQDKHGDIHIRRALEINAAFEVSLQCWSTLAKEGILDAAGFIQRVPHLSAVWGEQNSAFLRKRHTLLQAHPLFADMQWSDQPATLNDWMPLMMAGRKQAASMAATCVEYGSDVNFGALTRQLVAYLKTRPNFTLLTQSHVSKLKRSATRERSFWQVRVQHLPSGQTQSFNTPFVFLGAGGGALPLLQQSGIPEAHGYGGFPVSGQWLICNNPELIHQHHAKVYSQAAVGAPPMSVPHLDTRLIQGKPALLFGPYAGFTTRFLKQGSRFDLAKSVKFKNIKSLLGACRHNVDLTKYLIKEVFQSHEQRMQALRVFLPDANGKDWSLAHAGQRVQIIKRCHQHWGKLEFGTEIVASEDGSLAALLGASPGASVSVKAMLDVLQRCFAARMQSASWQERLKALIPSYGESLIDDAALLARVRRETLTTLNLAP